MARQPRRLAGIGATDLPDATAFDAYTGPARELTVDPVRGIVALHDGATAGGIQFTPAGGGDTLRQFCHNGAMQVWQNPFVTNANVAHLTPMADGFVFGNNSNVGAEKFTASKETVDVPAGAFAACKLTCSTAATSLAANTDAHIRYVIPSARAALVKDKTIYVSFSVKTNKPGVYSLITTNQARDAAFVSQYTVTAADVWQDFTVAVPLADRLGSGWNFEAAGNFGISFRWGFLAGSSLKAPATGWLTPSYVVGPDNVNLADTVGNYIMLSKVSITDVPASSFVAPDYERALQESYRLSRVFTFDVSGVNIIGIGAGSNSINFDVPLAVSMYSPPRVKLFGTLDVDFVIQEQQTGTGVMLSISSILDYPRSKDFLKFSVTCPTTVTPGALYAFRAVTTNAKIFISGYQ